MYRYVAFHPERIERAVAGAPGWYMWPDPNLPYPIGALTNNWPGSKDYGSYLNKTSSFSSALGIMIKAYSEEPSKVVISPPFKGGDVRKGP